MLDMLNSSFSLLASGPKASQEDLAALQNTFGQIPSEYRQLVQEATEIELQHRNGQYIRIWGPEGCVEMNEGYGIRNRIPSAFPIGDDGGGHVIMYYNGKDGFGIYHVGYGNLDGDDAIFVATDLTELICHATGIDRF
jgi:hypothetical protein